MPIYAYQCQQCDHQQDVLQKLSDPVLITCAICSQETFNKQIAIAGAQLKGSGWYSTDFAGTCPTINEAKISDISSCTGSCTAH